MNATTYSAAVIEWLRGSAQPLSGTRAGAVGDLTPPDLTPPDLTPPDLAPLGRALGAASVVGLGESTRFSAETFGVRERIFRILVSEYGFRALALQDGARSGERMDRYVLGGPGTAEEALGQAWRPWRTAELAGALEWIRAFNREHPGDPVRVFGIQPPHAEPSDYDAVLEYVRQVAPDRVADLDAHLAPIRTAHRMDEHVQRHQGIHPGRPFAAHARDAVALIQSLPESPERAAALDRARLILAFHEQSVAGRGSFAMDESAQARRIIDRYERTGARIAYWDGIAHTAALGSDVHGVRALGLGGYLRERFGADYVSVAIGFHHGDLGLAVAPDPAPELLDALLGAVDLPAYTVDLRAPAAESVRAWLDAPAELRVISGVYDPAQDEAARMTVPALAAAFDVLVHIREATPVDWLPVEQ
ncbi:erythromycin esterase family protein [Nocardia sp. 2]|uniref:Erythromycin esterase family protein n=1 Tax=Nocardia acididurans TaxID=2802282 RepID=A0ABS1MDJ4_9NOCA|nr:erythromycin esterase family protein [Nocardia acididurans]MBL1078641.1 erythromycin esterase family protein [Nocardia acididurans]